MASEREISFMKKNYIPRFDVNMLEKITRVWQLAIVFFCDFVLESVKQTGSQIDCDLVI
jgi:hypothetical protein